MYINKLLKIQNILPDNTDKHIKQADYQHYLYG